MSQIIDYLYRFFHRDFVQQKTYIAKTIYIDPRSYRKDEGKEVDFGRNIKFGTTPWAFRILIA